MRAVRAVASGCLPDRAPRGGIPMERLKQRADFLAAAKGARVPAGPFVLQARERGDAAAPRFGFTVSKKVGTAVRRNLLRRRLKAVCHEALGDGVRGVDVVVRALPGAAEVEWPELREEVLDALTRRSARPDPPLGPYVPR